MAHFAKLGANGKVISVLTLDNKDMLNADGVEDETVGQQYLEHHNNWPAQMWIQTSYNTYGGVHYDRSTNPPTPSKDQSKALRKNYAGVTFIYDKKKDAFYEPQPYPSWTLNETTCIWEAPVAYPSDDKSYEWDETTKSWKE